MCPIPGYSGQEGHLFRVECIGLDRIDLQSPQTNASSIIGMAIDEAPVRQLLFASIIWILSDHLQCLDRRGVSSPAYPSLFEEQLSNVQEWTLIIDIENRDYGGSSRI